VTAVVGSRAEGRGVLGWYLNIFGLMSSYSTKRTWVALKGMDYKYK